VSGNCLATSGPGGIHLANGPYDAKLDHVPVLAITGMQKTSVLGTGAAVPERTDIHIGQYLARRRRLPGQHRVR
jgi:thiamine pyrophosphate-dependent acetolactate synthase large subunit-like protein